MTDIELSPNAIDFIQSWKRFDRTASRLSASAEVAFKNNRVHYWPMDALKRETYEMSDALNALCTEFGMHSVYFMRALQDLRRDGVDHAKCVQLILKHLEVVPV